jgi:hypothetical protein
MGKDNNSIPLMDVYASEGTVEKTTGSHDIGALWMTDDMTSPMTYAVIYQFIALWL